MAIGEGGGGSLGGGAETEWTRELWVVVCHRSSNSGAGIGQEKKLKPLLVTPKDIDSYVVITEQNFTTLMNGDGLHSFHWVKISSHNSYHDVAIAKVSTGCETISLRTGLARDEPKKSYKSKESDGRR